VLMESAATKPVTAPARSAALVVYAIGLMSELTSATTAASASIVSAIKMEDECAEMYPPSLIKRTTAVTMESVMEPTRPNASAPTCPRMVSGLATDANDASKVSQEKTVTKLTPHGESPPSLVLLRPPKWFRRRWPFNSLNEF